MTSPLAHRAAVLIATVVATVSVSALAVAPAEAAGRRFGDVGTFLGATVEACRTATADGRSWRIHHRLDNTRNGPGRTRSGVVVATRGGETTSRRSSTGPVPGGTVSPVRSLLVPRAPRWALLVGVGSDSLGDGRAVGVGELRRC